MHRSCTVLERRARRVSRPSCRSARAAPADPVSSSSSGLRPRSGSACHGGEAVDLAFITTPSRHRAGAGRASRRSSITPWAVPASVSAFARADGGSRSARPNDQADVAHGEVRDVCTRRCEPPAHRAHVRAARHCGRDESKDAARAGLRAGGGKSRRRRGRDPADARQRDLARRRHGAASGRCLPSSRATSRSTLPSARAPRMPPRHVPSSLASRLPHPRRRSPRKASSDEVLAVVVTAAAFASAA